MSAESPKSCQAMYIHGNQLKVKAEAATVPTTLLFGLSGPHAFQLITTNQIAAKSLGTVEGPFAPECKHFHSGRSTFRLSGPRWHQDIPANPTAYA